jgi:adenine-specific DNA-methyltransferase
MSISRPEKLKMETADMTAANIERIAGLFPNVITEIEDEDGNVRRGIDFDLLRQELSGDYVEGREERYDFTWVGKRQAIIEANRPIQKTLRPCIEESKDWEDTENVYIEGDNLDALKLLQESYLNKVKMIYIDPPYNTGNDFIYNDNFVMDSDEYDEETGAVDEYGNRRFKNNKERGRYHSDWCSMLYPRLKLAHNLLREDGVIFVSIDDNEVHNLRKMMDEIFGENCTELYVWDVREEGNMPKTARHTVRKEHEYILTGIKNKDLVNYNKYSEYKYIDNEEWGNADNDPRGDWMSGNISRNQIKSTTGDKYFEIKTPGGSSYKRNWKITEDEYHELLKDNRLYFGKEGNGVPRIKVFKNEPVESIQSSIFSDLQSSQTARSQINGLIGKVEFDHPKPVSLINRLATICTNKDDIILDFFAGSSTTAHAVMQLNAEDGGNRKFIMVQLPEPCDEKNEAYKAGFKNISEIGKERIRRAGEQIRKEIEEENRQTKLGEEPKSVPDIGFRVFKIGDTNMKDVYYSAAEYSQETIEGLVDNVKEDRTDLDLLYQVLINWGLPLDLKHEMEEIDGYTIHTVDTDALIACFEPNIPESVMRKIAEKKPLRAVFRDGSFRDSPSKLNIEGIFKTIAPDTKLRVI